MHLPFCLEIIDRKLDKQMLYLLEHSKTLKSMPPRIFIIAFFNPKYNLRLIGEISIQWNNTRNKISTTDKSYCLIGMSRVKNYQWYLNKNVLSLLPFPFEISMCFFPYSC